MSDRRRDLSGTNGRGENRPEHASPAAGPGIRLGSVTTRPGEGPRLGVVSPAAADARPDHRGRFAFRPGLEPVPGYRLTERVDSRGPGESWKAFGPAGVVALLSRYGDEDEIAPSARRSIAESLEIVHAAPHPNLLPILGMWWLQGELVVASRWASESLLDRCDQAIADGLVGIPADELVESLGQAARGIDHLNHFDQSRPDGSGQGGAGFQHRNLGPASLLRIDGQVLVGGLEFVTAAEAEADTDSLDPIYLAPEALRGRPSRRSDQYALAAIYCRLRGGRAPFEGNDWDLMFGHCYDEPDLTMIPPRERPAVARALAKRPESRWLDCGSFVEALRSSAAMSSEERRVVPPLPPSPSESFTSSGRGGGRWPLAASAAVLGAVFVTACLLAPDREPDGVRESRDLRERIATMPPAPPEPTPDSPPPPHSSPAVAVAARTEPSRVEAAKDDEAAPTDPLATQRTAMLSPPPAEAFLTAPVAPPETALEPKRIVPWRALASELAGTAKAIVARRVAEIEVETLKQRRLAEQEALDRILARKQIAEALARLGSREEESGPPRDLAAREPSPRTATIAVLMPSATSELVVRGEVGKGNPDEWYGPTRVIHTPPYQGGKDYLVGAFWKDEAGVPVTRSCLLNVESGKSYEIDLSKPEPSWREVDR